MTPRLYVIVERNAALGDVRVIGRGEPPYRWSTLDDAIAACVARMPDPSGYRRYYSLSVHAAPGYDAPLYVRQGEV